MCAHCSALMLLINASTTTSLSLHSTAELEGGLHFAFIHSAREIQLSCLETEVF